MKIKIAMVLAALSASIFTTVIALLFLAQSVGAAAPSGLNATLATSSTVTAGPGIFSSTTPRTIITADQPNCASRVITTTEQPIMLSFGAGFNSTTSPSGTRGHLQAASTTVVYDAGLYGCGQWTVYGFLASSTITFSEFR